ncbi:protein kinase [Streptomyces cinereoruber]|uniref:non-specific serine/threonine protein kinase n=1 Tax=Streptomyces cinereoruber TaxID=67260 RepID=A0AAV4KDX8_9ACTN|nr:MULTISPECIES: serine/threonine-protein kinase [Streptomyces]AVH93857.1 serine/threonine protein kinase [Streptomyces sp. WAC00288]MBB4162074.1 tRNA A-37 threonylcarbamoyl transferase component Bud32 [Streptomyces cinereoruber]NIH63806.1 tRNA A-37 threonylcarbamoyl transferase component Bud32 [Streptomyces cinereoruber]QEV36402.1 serine/threonine protein kinase [Streptomyces cinereoruber]GGR12814.1 protein kinase [Streptomyces cinereoruber]
MTTSGRAGEEPTSYGLRPPVPPPRAGAAAPSPGVSGGPGEGEERGERHERRERAADGAGSSGAPPSPEAGAGRLLGGRYRLLERLGAGGMGTVWRARDEVVDRDVAVKEPRVPEHFSAAERSTAHQRMRREARAAARIDHPSVVTLHDVVVEDDRPWIVMELLRGRSLAEILDEGTLEPREAARIGQAVLGALHAAHEAGVLHRDVKPGNVMVCRHDRVVLTDFGIAQVEGEQKLTETGAFIGSPEYIAPERVLGRRPGPESDLWSLGITLYQAVEGVSPFRRRTTPSTLQAILLAELPPPQRSREMTALITGLLRKEPENRLTVQAARPLLSALVAPPARPVPERTPTVVVDAPPDEPPAPLPVRLLRSRYGVGAAAAVVLALVVTLVLRFTGDGPPEGWKEYDEYRMGLSVAAPADWTITVEDELDNDDGAYRGTRYTAPKGDVWLSVDRMEKATETPRAIAERWKREHESASPPVGGAASVATVESTTHQGRDAAIITEAYSRQEDEVTRRLYRTLIVVTSRQERVTLGVDVPDGKGAAKTADDLLEKARSAFEIRNP